MTPVQHAAILALLSNEVKEFASDWTFCPSNGPPINMKGYPLRHVCLLHGLREVILGYSDATYSWGTIPLYKHPQFAERIGPLTKQLLEARKPDGIAFVFTIYDPAIGETEATSKTEPGEYLMMILLLHEHESAWYSRVLRIGTDEAAVIGDWEPSYTTAEDVEAKDRHPPEILSVLTELRKYRLPKIV